MKVNWSVKAFDALSLAELYALLRLRSEVFVVEQNCVFQDMDNSDTLALHVLGWAAADAGDGQAGPEVDKGAGLATPQPPLLACARCFGPGVKFSEASIGRVVTAASARGIGLGHALMRAALDAVHDRWGAQPIRIGAQAHLQAFYEQHGFVREGEPYIEDGIPHIEMLRTATPGALHVE